MAIWSSSRKLATANTDVKLLILTLLVASTSIGAVNGQTKPRTADDSDAPSRRFRVCLDPGHPSENNDGGELTNGLREVTVNWEVAVLLRRELENDGFTVVMTKESESQFVTNKDRAEIANLAQADLLLRLHADAGKATGFTVYYPRKKGTVHGVTGPGADVLRTSKSAAQTFHAAFAQALRDQLKDNGLRGDEATFIGEKQGALTGSIFSKVPTILVEMVFLTTTQDAEWIKQSSNKKLMAQAIAEGVCAVRSSSAIATKTALPAAAPSPAK
jgi:N-acetylmuramoyl-L-alanine amidase